MNFRAIIHFIAFILIAPNLFAQEDIEKITKPIVEEGMILYKSEMASWYGTDIFLEKFKDQSKIGGYFSYPVNNLENCVFFSKGDSPVVIGTMTFDSTYKTERSKTDLTERNFTPEESALYNIRTRALSIINKDTLFKRYSNANLNLIPVISKNERKVYVITGPTKNGVVIFGNDYLLTFDDNNELLSKRKIHRNIITIEYGEKTSDSNKVIATMHNHLPETGDFITATDICTLMLYEKFTGWGTHYVTSKNYVSIWDCQKNQLVTLTTKAFKKISDSK